MIILCARMHTIAQMGLYFCVIPVNLHKDSAKEDLGKMSADEREKTRKTANEVWKAPQSAVKGRKKIAYLLPVSPTPQN